MLEPRNQQTLPRVLRKRAERQANKAWIVTDQRSFTYGEMNRQSDRLARCLAKARELAYLGEFIGAEEALRIGLVNRVVAGADLPATVGALARRIASRAPIAVQLHKIMLDRGQEESLDTMLNFETEALVQTAMTRDNLEGTRAFFEKREPRFTGE